eukprot:2605890-Rhodomonas_salina.1
MAHTPRCLADSLAVWVELVYQYHDYSHGRRRTFNSSRSFQVERLGCLCGPHTTAQSPHAPSNLNSWATHRHWPGH